MLYAAVHNVSTLQLIDQWMVLKAPFTILACQIKSKSKVYLTPVILTLSRSSISISIRTEFQFPLFTSVIECAVYTSGDL